MPSTQEEVNETRVNIVTKVKVDGAISEIELPFQVAVFADLSGDSDKKLEPLHQRAFDTLTSEHIDQFLQDVAPALNLEIPDHMTDTGKKEMLRLAFNRLADFRPEAIVQQGSLKTLKDLRDRMQELLAKLGRGEATDELSRRLTQFKEELEKSKGQ